MTAPVTRRTFLGAAGGSAVSVGFGGFFPRPAAAAPRSAGTAAPVRPFPLTAVALLGGRFQDNMTRTLAYLGFVDPDRLLHTFRLNAGLPSTAQACGGWEAPSVQLRGHSTGHLMSALAQAHANTGDAAYAAKGGYLVAELAKCQAAGPAAGYTSGYLSAFPESVFAQLEAGGQPWAPYYTIHKIMAGLLDQYRLSGNRQALGVLTGMAAWTEARCAALTDARMQALLKIEFGGMNDVLAELYQVTGDPAHLRTARRFDHEEIFEPLASGVDKLAGYHANTQIPKIVGAVREYEATGERRYLGIARFFWDTVVHHHTYVIGGNSNNELFCPPDEILSRLGDDTCENCNSYNMLKLSRLLFLHDRRPEYMDYYEWTLYNQMLGEQDPDSAHGFVTYYTGLWAGTHRQVKGGLGADAGSYSSDYTNFSCDHGTGMETHTKFADSIYFRSGDELYVNLFIPSRLQWAERKVGLRLETGYPQDERIRLTVTGDARFTLKVRVPGWLRRRPAVRLNGRPLRVVAEPGTYLELGRSWRDGDTLELTLPMTPAWRKANDNPQAMALTCGPVVLAAGYGDTTLNAIPELDPASLRPTAEPLRFTATAAGAPVSLQPFSDIQHQNYNVYWMIRPPARKPALRARYPLATGTADATGTFPAATLATGATLGDGAAILDGSSGYVALPAGLITGLVELTVAAWVNLDTIANNARVFDLGFHKQTYLFLTPRTGAGKARFAMKICGMDGEDGIDAAGPLPTGGWTHVAVTLGGATGVLYVDGTEAGRDDALVMSPLVLGATTQNFLGKSQNTTHPYLDGQIADFRVYDHALTAAEIAALHTAGRTA